MSPLSPMVKSDFNPLPPRGGRRLFQHIACVQIISIHSLHAEGDKPCHVDAGNNGISIHSLHAEGDLDTALEEYKARISIHSLHAEGDVKHFAKDIVEFGFQSTPSTRRETAPFASWYSSFGISIHSLHAEGDSHPSITPRIFANFNPLPPRGGRQMVLIGLILLMEFQSTPSTRRETT